MTSSSDVTCSFCKKSAPSKEMWHTVRGDICSKCVGVLSVIETEPTDFNLVKLILNSDLHSSQKYGLISEFISELKHRKINE